MQIIGTEKGLSQRDKVWVLKDRLAYLFRNPGRVYRMTTREPTDTGFGYSDEAIDAGELWCALGRCSERQQQVLRLWLGRRRLPQGAVAKALGVSLVTVKRDASEALKKMAAMVWDDEGS